LSAAGERDSSCERARPVRDNGSRGSKRALDVTGLRIPLAQHGRCRRRRSMRFADLV